MGPDTGCAGCRDRCEPVDNAAADARGLENEGEGKEGLGRCFWAGHIVSTRIVGWGKE